MRRAAFILGLAGLAAAWGVGRGLPPLHAAQPAPAELPKGVDVSTPETVSVSLESADLKAVVTALARACGMNVVGSGKLSGNVTLHLSDAPVRQALDIILRNAGFVLVAKESGIYEIMTEAESIKAQQREDVVRVEVFPLKYAEVENIAKLLVSAAVLEASRIGKDDQSNSLVISGTGTELKKVAQIIEAVDKPVPQVAIQARIVEIYADRAKNLGVSLDVIFRSANLGDNGVGGVGVDLSQDTVEASTFDVTFVSDRVDAAISALAQKEVAEVLSAPRITTAHNRQAEIKVVDQIPVITRTTRIVDGVTVTDETVTFKETGLTLTVTPRVLAGNKVAMVVEPSVLELTGWTDTDPPAPIIDTRSAKTEVTIDDGKWLVIGGLMRYNEQQIERGIPVLKDVPLLGWFFRTTYTTRDKSNLVIFVSATVLNPARIDKDTAAQRQSIREHRKKHQLKGGPFPPAETPEKETGKGAGPTPRPGGE